MKDLEIFWYLLRVRLFHLHYGMGMMDDLCILVWGPSSGDLLTLVEKIVMMRNLTT